MRVIFLIFVLLVSYSSATPSINFTLPTPADAISTTNTSAEFNVSVNESSLDTFIWNWNGTNYSIYDPTLVLMFNFDNVSSLGDNETYAIDTSQYGNNGTFTNGPVYDQGRYDSALSFDGIDSYVDLGADSSLNIANNLSISLWMKTSDASYEFIVGGYNSNSPNNGYGLVKSGVTSNKLSIWLGGPSWITGSTTVTDEVWHYVTVVVSGTTANLYVDGNLDATGAITGLASYGGNKYLGRYTGAGDYYFNGTMDEVRIYNRSLSVDEITQQYYSNIYKYDTNSWQFYSNESNLTNGTAYTYFACANDTLG
ncbi:LamG domain-containing protein, partial [Candidatus Micrarchaeota archaeon]|nr:LamG domain-containing protein [Candidatus Micrarchaeota archaeon]